MPLGPVHHVAISVPDLITLVTTDEGEPITTELVQYGLRADVLVIPCPDLLKTPEAPEVVGPRAFGYDIHYRLPATLHVRTAGVIRA